MPAPRSRKEPSKSIRPQAKRAASKPPAKKAEAHEAGAFFFSKKGELVIRDAGLTKKLRRFLKQVSPANGDVAAEIIVKVDPPPLVPPPRVNSMCICVVRRSDLKTLPASNPVRTPRPI